MAISEIVFVGFKKHVVALDRATGVQRWHWTAPKGGDYPALLVDGDQLFVSVMGYTYCLDPYTGKVLWQNELAGLGVGVACIATSHGSTNSMRSAASQITSRASSGSGAHA